MKMYILVRESIPLGFAMVAVAHAPLVTHLRFQESDDHKEWLSTSFKKVVCKVSDAEFEKAKQHSDFVVITESTLDHQELALGFKPRAVWPKAFNFYRLYR
jgi:peptidyl-tRNA hydrolase